MVFVGFGGWVFPEVVSRGGGVGTFGLKMGCFVLHGVFVKFGHSSEDVVAPFCEKNPAKGSSSRSRPSGSAKAVWPHAREDCENSSLMWPTPPRSPPGAPAR